MKNLLNCHAIGLHSFPISCDNGLYRRVFYAGENHQLWKEMEIAVHPHHVDIKLTILEGELYNPIFEINKEGAISLRAYKWQSHIQNGNGGFEYIGNENLKLISYRKYKKGESVTMKACELHTIQIDKHKKCVWLIEESSPTCDYFPINYSPYDLTKWSTNGLYIETTDEIKHKYIGKYYDLL